ECHDGSTAFSGRGVPQRYGREHGPGHGPIGPTDADGRGGLGLLRGQTLGDGILRDGTRTAVLPDGLQGEVRYKVVKQVLIPEPEDTRGFGVGTDDTALGSHLDDPPRHRVDNAAIEFLTRPQGLFGLLALRDINTGA